MTLLHAEYAWLGGERAEAGVLIVVEGGCIAEVRSGMPRPEGARPLPGLTLPGMANAHSHAFQRALRGRVQRGGGSFWTWREDMYALAGRLDVDGMHALARAAFAEMALAGITSVGEFHYVHAGGNEMGEALLAAAGEAGIRITLIDACYLAGGFGEPASGAQRRFADRGARAWAQRASALAGAAAIHSVRAVPADELATVVRWAAERDAPLHFHVSEQPAENEACLAAHGLTPVGLLAAHGALGPRSCAVHATHLTDEDVELLASSGTSVCMCPTTERDLADGIGPARRLAEAGCTIALGSDSNAVVDPFEEARALEMDERLASGERGHWTAAELLRALTADGHAVVGRPEGGRIAAGAPADLITIGLGSVRLAGAAEPTLLESVVFGATGGDVTHVMVDGREVVRDGRHLLVGDVAGALTAAIEAVTA